MSKSYNNTIPLFEGEKKLKKAINKIKTNMLEPGEAKDPEDSIVFEIYQAFASKEQTQAMRQKFADGIAWGEAKKELFELINEQLAEPRERYNALMADPKQVEDILQAGAVKARARAKALLTELRTAVGLVKFK
jgi:tryptophanyl-tRNA synthetase